MLTFAMVKVGSILWRIENYGLKAAIKYIISDKLNWKKNTHIGTVIKNISELNQLLKKNNKVELEKIQYSFGNNYSIINNTFIEFKENGAKIKSDVIGDNLDTTKFEVLNYLINSSQFDCILETGTQHGSTTLFIEQLVSNLYPSNYCTISTFDVKTDVMPNSLGYVHFISLSTPVRKNFKTYTKKIAFNKQNILFFHDSDHSYENMMFEFEWAWEILKVSFIVSDDVSGNNSFKDFALSKNLIPIICKFGSGPAVGVLGRSNS
jgi:cephalosporin hydroxylase